MVDLVAVDAAFEAADLADLGDLELSDDSALTEDVAIEALAGLCRSKRFCME
jgi:hypothetical protein